MYEKSAAVKALADKLKRDELELNAEPEKITVEALFQKAREVASSKDVNPGALVRSRRRVKKNIFLKEDILELAHAILREKDEIVKRLLLRGMFWFKSFPLDAAPLLECLQSTNKILYDAAMDLLEEFKEETYVIRRFSFWKKKDWIPGRLACSKKIIEPE